MATVSSCAQAEAIFHNLSRKMFQAQLIKFFKKTTEGNDLYLINIKI